jgi:hypothetical protein
MPEVTRNVAVALPPALFSQSLECPVALALSLTCQLDNFTAKVDEQFGVFKPSGAPNGKSMDEMTRAFVLRRDTDFAAHFCVEHPKQQTACAEPRDG